MLNRNSSRITIFFASILIALRLLFPVGSTIGRTHSWIFAFNPFISGTNFQIDYGLTILHIVLIILASIGLLLCLSSLWHRTVNSQENRARSVLRRISKRTLLMYLLVFTIGCTTIGIYYLNKYLKNENYLLYATGTNEKAFLNSTWKMSPKEVERANNTQLEPLSSAINPYFRAFKVVKLRLGQPEYVLDTSRLSEYAHPTRLQGLDGIVRYSFFDNMMFEYRLEFPETDTTDIKEIILPALSNRFGIPDTLDGRRFHWDTDTQSVLLSYFKPYDKKYYIETNIYTKHKQFLNAIEKMIIEEQEVYF